LDRVAKVAIGVGLGLAAFSFLLIITGSAISWGAAQFNNPGGESFGSSLAGTGWLIIALMFVTLFVIVAVWLYAKTRNSGGI